jgi:hypothetical protein
MKRAPSSQVPPNTPEEDFPTRHSGNLGSCCAVLALCETHGRGEHDGFGLFVMCMYVCSCTYAVHDKLSCRVNVV